MPHDNVNAAIARACHEANRTFCQILGDDSQLPWDEAPEWQRSSAIAGVEFHLANPNAGPAASHENWAKQKVAEGWKYGAVKDVSKKEHPCLVTYAELPPEQKAKDAIFISIVHALAGTSVDASRIKFLEAEVERLAKPFNDALFAKDRDWKFTESPSGEIINCGCGKTYHTATESGQCPDHASLASPGIETVETDGSQPVPPAL